MQTFYAWIDSFPIWAIIALFWIPAAVGAAWVHHLARMRQKDEEQDEFLREAYRRYRERKP